MRKKLNAEAQRKTEDPGGRASASMTACVVAKVRLLQAGMTRHWVEPDDDEHPYLDVTGAMIRGQTSQEPSLLKEACLAHALRLDGHKVPMEAGLLLNFRRILNTQSWLLFSAILFSSPRLRVELFLFGFKKGLGEQGFHA